MRFELRVAKVDFVDHAYSIGTFLVASIPWLEEVLPVAWLLLISRGSA
jgi:hypothetical protein